MIGSGVPESTPEWYVRWVRKFALSIRGKPLRERSAEDVRASRWEALWAGGGHAQAPEKGITQSRHML